MILLLTAAIAPAVFLMYLFYLKDKYEKEPLRLVVTVFLRGVFITVPAAGFEKIFSLMLGYDLLSASYLGVDEILIASFLGVALPEEFFKFIAVYSTVYKLSEFDERIDGVVYSVAASLGFATLENIFYVLEGGLGVALIRAIFSIPGHALFGMVMGIFLARLKFGRGCYTDVIAFPTLLHGLYDFMLSYNPGLFLIVWIPVFIVVLLWGLRRMNRMLKLRGTVLR